MDIAVVTGAHPFDVRSFQDSVVSATRARCYVQGLYEFGAEPTRVRQSYDAVVFYHWHLDVPAKAPDVWWKAGTREAIESLGTGQGLVLLHHSIVAFPGWDTWDSLCGFSERTFDYHQDQLIDAHVVDPAHPVTHEMSDFRILDETYSMRSPNPSKVTPLLSTSHEQSMTTLAWAHHVQQSRVVCLQLGHGPSAFTNPGFRRLLGNGVRWVAGLC